MSWNSDFVSDFLEFTQDAYSPLIYRKWAGISLVAGALERRAWARMGRYTTFPNLYITLVGHPGVGKSIIQDVRELWRDSRCNGGNSQAFNLAPKSVTKASLIDSLAKAKNKILLPGVPPNYVYQSLLVAAAELSVLLPAYDNEFIGILNDIYDNPPDHTEERRTGTVRSVIIEHPQLNIIAGEQPGRLATVYPEEFWSTGLASRMIMIYAEGGPPRDLFAEAATQEHEREGLIGKLGHLATVYGAFRWHVDAVERLRSWHMAGGPPEPRHSKLAHYVKRRTNLHLPKLAMVSAISRTGGLAIDLFDVDRAIEWLLEAEGFMPDIFRAMQGKSDGQLVEELYYYIHSVWARSGQKPVHSSHLWAFLTTRATSDKIPKVIDLAVMSGVLTRKDGEDFFLPRPQQDHRLEE